MAIIIQPILLFYHMKYIQTIFYTFSLETSIECILYKMHILNKLNTYTYVTLATKNI